MALADDGVEWCRWRADGRNVIVDIHRGRKLKSLMIWHKIESRIYLGYLCAEGTSERACVCVCQNDCCGTAQTLVRLLQVFRLRIHTHTHSHGRHFYIRMTAPIANNTRYHSAEIRSFIPWQMLYGESIFRAIEASYTLPHKLLPISTWIILYNASRTHTHTHTLVCECYFAIT